MMGGVGQKEGLLISKKGDYVNYGNSPELNIATDDFTIESLGKTFGRPHCAYDILENGTLILTVTVYQSLLVDVLCYLLEGQVRFFMG